MNTKGLPAQKSVSEGKEDNVAKNFKRLKIQDVICFLILSWPVSTEKSVLIICKVK